MACAKLIHVRIRSDESDSVARLYAGMNQCVREVLDALRTVASQSRVRSANAKEPYKTPYV